MNNKVQHAYSGILLSWILTIPYPKIFFQYSISWNSNSYSFITSIFRLIWCKFVIYCINDNLALDLQLETWRWSKLQTSEKARFVFSELPELLVFFIPSFFFWKKFLIWSKRKPRVINIILSSSVKFTVNQVRWMWAYALAPMLRVLYSQLHFHLEFEQLSLSITLKCLLFWLGCHNFHYEYCYRQGLKCLAEFQPLFLFLYILIITPYLNCWQIIDILFFAQL